MALRTVVRTPALLRPEQVERIWARAHESGRKYQAQLRHDLDMLEDFLAGSDASVKALARERMRRALQHIEEA